MLYILILKEPDKCSKKELGSLHYQHVKQKEATICAYQNVKPCPVKHDPSVCGTSGLRNQTKSCLLQRSGSKGERNLQAKNPGKQSQVVEIQNSAQTFNQNYANPFSNNISNAKVFSRGIQSISQRAHFLSTDQKNGE